MQIEVIGTIKAIGKKEYSSNGKKRWPGKWLYRIGLLIETETDDIVVYLPNLYKQMDYSLLIEELGLEVEDKVKCVVDISSFQWKYSFITNIHCKAIAKITW